MHQVYITLFSESKDRKEPALFMSLMRQYIPKACPMTFHKTEGEDYSFTEENLSLFEKFWWDGILFWDSKGSRAHGDAFCGTEHKLTTISHVFDYGLEDSNACKEFLKKISEILSLQYSFVHIFPEEESEILSRDFRLAEASSRHLWQCLPGVPWAACYGAIYVDMFGKENLLALPIHETKQIKSDMVYCQLTLDFTDIIQQPLLIEKTQNIVYDKLGKDAFFDPDSPDEDGRIPSFSKPMVVIPQ